MTVSSVDEIARGKVWLGDAAKAHGLVDVIGGIDQAIAEVKRLAELEPDSPIVELPAEKNGLLDLVLDLMGAKVDAPDAAAIPKLLGKYLRAVVPFVVYRPDEPVAMWEGMEAP
jgi:protease-4